jgi:hypothetical protein
MISKDKTYRTRDGREVRVYATDAGLMYPIHGAIKTIRGDSWVQHDWLKDGRFWEFREHEKDLLEVKPRLACVKVKIDCEEGEGL